MIGYVYLIEEIPHCSGESGPWTKIGYSKNDPAWRMNANLKRGNPRELRLAEYYEFKTEEAAREGERKAHAHFLQYAHQKEWFQVSWHQVADWLSKMEGAKALIKKSDVIGR